MAVCFESFEDTRRLLYSSTDTDNSVHPEPIIYFVTPTYPRREQVAEITRLGQTLMHVPYLHWIVADDTPVCNNFLNNLLKKFGKFLYTNIVGSCLVPNVHTHGPIRSQAFPTLTLPARCQSFIAPRSWFHAV